MEEHRKHAYRTLLSAALLHLKWDLACIDPGGSWNPLRWRQQARFARTAALRSRALHNLAIFATLDFRGFNEEQFWNEIQHLLERLPDLPYSDYRGLFEAALRGDCVQIIAPGDGVGRCNSEND